jgi:hypothetical protein
MSVNHYPYLEAHLPTVLKTLGQEVSAISMITGDGDKCYGYSDMWERRGIPFPHGAAIYLLSYLSPYNKECRQTQTGWVPVQDWVANNYHPGDGHEFSKILPAIDDAGNAEQTSQPVPTTSGPLIRRFQERMECMKPEHSALYRQWLTDKTNPKLDFPEWVIREDNPGFEIPGLDWGHLWAGWEKIHQPGENPDRYIAKNP